MNLSPKLACPSCGGSRLVPGNVIDKQPRNFVPQGKFMFLGYTPYGFVCLECGYFGSCLSEEDRLHLENKIREG